MHFTMESKRRIFQLQEVKMVFSEDVRKFLIEHELGRRRMANMLRRELDALIEHDDTERKGADIGMKWNNNNKEPIQIFKIVCNLCL